MSEELLAGEWGAGDTVLCDVADGKFVFSSDGTGEIPRRGCPVPSAVASRRRPGRPPPLLAPRPSAALNMGAATR